MELDLAKRHQTMIVLWAALLMSVVMYFFVSQLAPPATAPPNSMLTFTLTAIGTFLVVISFVIKQKLLKQSVDNQDIGLVQKALVIACAVCEAAALLGLVERFTVSGRDYLLLFVIALAGIAFHFPRRSQLEAASYKKQ
ncbi:MAG TPA: hypothetical protein VIW64_11415 [Pyrinomonadaceae bacterium]|jgi:FtsH-binding integral membrane protein